MSPDPGHPAMATMQKYQNIQTQKSDQNRNRHQIQQARKI